MELMKKLTDTVGTVLGFLLYLALVGVVGLVNLALYGLSLAMLVLAAYFFLALFGVVPPMDHIPIIPLI